MSLAPPPNAVYPLNRKQRQQNEIIVAIGPPLAAAPPPPNLPCQELIEGSREEYMKFGVPLYEASIKGDWKAAYAILNQKPELVRYAITRNFDTPLHIAASAKSTSVDEFVINIVNLMEKKDLELQNKNYNTALIAAATAGNLRTAIIILEKNKAVLEIPGSHGMMPLYVAALFARDDMVMYLYDNSNKMSGNFWTNENRGWVLQRCVEADIFDISVKIVKDCPAITSNKRFLSDILLVLAQKTAAFEEKETHIIFRIVKSIFGFHSKVGHVERERDALQLLRIIWNKIAMMRNNDIDHILQGPPLEIGEEQNKRITYPYRVLFIAAKKGNIIFIIELIRSYPDLIWTLNDKGVTIFHVAARRRQAHIYNLLYQIGSMKDLIAAIEDENGNNMLHLVAKRVKSKRYQNVAGFALQMQRELLWFMEVMYIVHPSYTQKKNKAGETPQDIFTRTHKDLVTQGERWMKETAPQCMVVATLIATIVFAAAFTLPGGYDQNTGIPMFRQKAALIVFVIADALSLISSAASLLMFLSMFTSGYSEHDFLESLPKKLILGFATLLVSIKAALIVFVIADALSLISSAASLLMFLSMFTSGYSEHDFLESLPKKLILGFATLLVSIATMMIAFSASFFLLYDKNLKWVPAMVTGFASMLVVVYWKKQVRFISDIFYTTYGSRYLFRPMKHILY